MKHKEKCVGTKELWNINENSRKKNEKLNNIAYSSRHCDVVEREICGNFRLKWIAGVAVVVVAQQEACVNYTQPNKISI